MSKKVHGMKGTKTYQAWNGLRNRCLNKNHPHYASYGGRGILVCPSWDSFLVFLADMGEAPDGMTLDRKDNNGPYSKANCRWATRIEQQQNTRKTKNVTVDGETKCVSEWERSLGLSQGALWHRTKSGISIEDAIRMGKP